MLRALLLASIASLAGCALPLSPAAKPTEAANDLNTAVHFGRMDIASELVRETAREKFTQGHASWGRMVRIVDYEVGTMNIRKDGDADVVVTVSWQRTDETTLRSTELTQRWTSVRGKWGLASEEERGGDPGLISEVVRAPYDDATPAPAPAARMRFQPRVIYEQ
jgi:hypothetical protein